MSRPVSYQEATARERLQHLFNPGSFEEFIPPSARVTSPHLAQLNAPVAFDDGVAIGHALLGGVPVYVAAQEGAFMGGAVGEVHGAKLVGLLRKAIADKVAVVLLVESGGVRLHEANAGLIAVSEVMRALLDARDAGVPVIALVGGANGAFGGMGIVTRCANVVIMSEEGRLAMSGPEVIETANGVEEFDSRDRALVWRTSGGKHRYLLGDCQRIVADDVMAFRQAAQEALAAFANQPTALTLEALEAEQKMLEARLQNYGTLHDPVDIWEAMQVPDAANVPMLDVDSFIAAAASHRQGV
ncbi:MULTISPECIES: biotin-independent malonate decarboxylase subunit beta [unclassified Duganella]|uniref:biotin-independent malonate decarboxylase subunit beta n=1 Tax=unclassified Duganella TaxID=2636909 RepID=UPI000891CC89|nr:MULTISPECIES: biotin-independent malonate decarboxylase subunit beta [unclassified Duganella]SDG52168.1 malonate decarboxylase beta subunit [Duganella sp. OV458]SDJ74916.1 malonate decarboxylase beta subunit [Duganella sp. OV510]